MTEFIQTDLPLLASRQFVAAHLHCGSCLPFHALWPYLRLTQWVGGIEADQAQLVPALADLLGSRPRRVLIAGSADSGVTALVRHASGDLAGRHDIILVDHCKTPLIAGREFAAAHGLSLRTQCCDLRDIDLVDAVDVVVGHSILPWLDAAGRKTVLRKLFDALAPGGRLVLTTRMAAPGQRAGLRERPPEWANELKAGLLARMAERSITRPGSDEDFDALVRAYTPGDFTHPPYADVAALQADIRDAGFVVDRWIETGKGVAYLANGQVKAAARQGILAITREK